MTLNIPSPVIRRRLIEAGLPDQSIHLADEVYCLLTPDDVQRIGPLVDDVLRQLGLEFTPDKFDCDDYADLVAVIIKLVHKKQNASSVKSAAAVGVVWGADHAFIVAIHKGSVGYYEPQPIGGFTLRPLPKPEMVHLCKL